MDRAGQKLATAGISQHEDGPPSTVPVIAILLVLFA